jgi:hypothetical protein
MQESKEEYGVDVNDHAVKKLLEEVRLGFHSAEITAWVKEGKPGGILKCPPYADFLLSQRAVFENKLANEAAKQRRLDAEAAERAQREAAERVQVSGCL